MDWLNRFLMDWPQLRPVFLAVAFFGPPALMLYLVLKYYSRRKENT